MSEANRILKEKIVQLKDKVDFKLTVIDDLPFMILDYKFAYDDKSYYFVGRVYCNYKDEYIVDGAILKGDEVISKIDKVYEIDKS
jgi:hypothetical protein